MANLASPDLQFRCGAAEVGGISRFKCQFPFRCCSHDTGGVPLTPREKDKPHDWWTATTEADSPDPSAPSVKDEPGTEVREVAPPTPGAFVAKDPEHPYMPTPKRSRVTKTTPSSHGKTAGEAEGHPINLH